MCIKTNIPYGRCSCVCFSVILLFHLLSFFAAFAQDKCATELADAENLYQEGHFEEAIARISECLAKSDRTKAESVQAYKLLAKVYDSQGLRNQAEISLRHLLTLDQNWRPDPNIDTPSFQRFAKEIITAVEKERREKEKPAPRVRQKWLLLGAGGLIAGGVTAAILLTKQGNGGEEGFPLPPGRPPK